jgi:molecular chaperone DnaJ
MRRLGAFGDFAGGGRRTRTSQTSGPGPGGGGPGGPGNARWQDFDIGGLGGLGDLFNSMFGGGRPGGPRGRTAERGQTVETSLEIPFRTAALGGQVPIELEVNEECGVCGGSGAAAGATFKVCPECSGRGVVSFGQGGFAVNRPCPQCMGRGQVPSEPCPNCRGAGEVRTRKKLVVNVPAGVDSGSKIRLKEQGGRGSAGGPAGDLLITFQVQPDRFFKRDGLDLVAVVPLNIAQATLGTKISVKTIEGKRISIRIPAGTAAGRRFRVRSHGITKDGQTGDLIVETTIVVPETLTEEQERIIKEFAEAGGLRY